MHKVGVVGVGFVGTAVSTGLDMSLGDNVEVREYDKFKNSESLYDVVNNSDVVFVCVPTPMTDEGACDTSIVQSSCFDIAKVAEERKTIVIKSTVPPGTTQSISSKLGGKHGLMFNPEFLTEANFINDFLNQNRIVLGSAKEATGSDVRKVVELYLDFIKTQKSPAFLGEVSSSSVAEMAKYFTNCFLATKLSFFNEMYDICESVKVPYDEVVEAFLLDERIGRSHYKVPGPDGKRGWGLSCFPKDLNAMIAFAKERGVDPLVLETAWTKNLLVREEHDWEELPQVNGCYKKK